MPAFRALTYSGGPLDGRAPGPVHHPSKEESMSEFVFSHADVLIADGRYHQRVNRGDAWFADDPMVAAYPHYFSRYPLTVHSSAGKSAPGLSLLSDPPPAAVSEPVASVPVVDDAQKAVEAINQPRTRSRRG